MDFVCENCHKPLTPGARNCGNCGISFNAPVPSAPIGSPARSDIADSSSTKSILLLILRFFWWGFLAFLLLGAVLMGLDGMLDAFWLLLIFGLPTLLFNRKLANLTKLLIMAVFLATFVAFGVYSKTSSGRAAHLAYQLKTQKRERVEAQQAAAEQKHERQQAAHDANVQAQQDKQAAADAAAQQQQAAADAAAQQQQDATAEQSTDEAKIDAYLEAQHFVSERLKSPDSAKYPDFEGNYVQLVGDNLYTVSSYVDSQNSFGAMLRSHWTAKLHKESENSWVLKDIQIDDPD